MTGHARPATSGTADAEAAQPEAPDQHLVVAVVRGLHGLRGVMRLEMLSDEPKRFSRGSRLFPEGSDAGLTVTWSQRNGPGILIRFREIADREAAEALRDRYLEAIVAADALPAGSYYWHEVQGAQVITTTGDVLGTIQDIFRAGGAEVYVVRGGPRGEVLIPAVSAVITEFAPREGRVVVDPDALGLGETEARSHVRGRLTTRARRRAETGPPT